MQNKYELLQIVFVNEGQLNFRLAFLILKSSILIGNENFFGWATSKKGLTFGRYLINIAFHDSRIYFSFPGTENRLRLDCPGIGLLSE